MKSKISILFLCLCVFFSACSDLQFQHIDGSAFGTYYAITYKGKANPTLQQSVDSILKDLDNTFSVFNPSSMINKVNHNEDIILNEDFLNVLNLSMEVADKTGGAFDITIEPLVELWGFGKDKRSTKITAEIIDSVKQHVGFHKIAVDKRKIVKEDSLIKLNFNAIAKGYAVDKIADFLVAKGYKNCIVDIGGEIVAKGKKYNDTEWNIGLQAPTVTRDGEMRASQTFHLKDQAVATSGNYRNYFEENGERYAHIIDPQTGYSEKSNLLSVSVIADHCVVADAYATAFMVMGLEKTKSFLSIHPELSCIFIYDQHGELQTEYYNISK